jgi:SAM-dependent methyltransferase
VTRAFETVACPLCGSEDAGEVLRGPDRLLGLPGEFRFVRCLSCGLIRQNPRPSAVLALYPDDYPAHQQMPGIGGHGLRELDLRYGQRKRVRTVQAHAHGGRLLDVGCGSGSFLVEMRRAPGWKVAGVEPVENAWRLCRSLGLDVVYGTLDQAEFPEGSFDAVTMWNVLEHVCDPVAELTKVRRLLRPEGILIAAVPVEEGRLRRWFGPFWVEWDLPRHLHVFSWPTLRRIFEQTGFVWEDVSAPFSEYRVWRMSLELWARSRIRSPRVRNMVSAAAAFMPVRAALTVALRGLVPPARASVQVFVARRG